VFTALAEYEVNVAQAIITTENGRAGDVLYLTAEDGRQISDTGRRLAEILKHLLAAI
jgi:UTP:GlnB (protein PII) uridylyltransferase